MLNLIFFVIILVIWQDTITNLSIRSAFLQSYEKPMGLIYRLLFCLRFSKKNIANKFLAFKQFLAALVMAVVWGIFVFYLTREQVFLLSNNINILIFLPILLGPFFYLLFCVISENYIVFIRGIRNFRMRTIAGLILGLSIFSSEIMWPDINYIKFIYFFMALIAVFFINYLFVLERLGGSKKNIYESNIYYLNTTQLFYGLFSNLELCYYYIILLTTFFKGNFLELKKDGASYLFYIILIIMFLMGISSFVSFASLSHKLRISYDFLEKKVLVSSLFLLGFISFFMYYVAF